MLLAAGERSIRMMTSPARNTLFFTGPDTTLPCMDWPTRSMTSPARLMRLMA